MDVLPAVSRLVTEILPIGYVSSRNVNVVAVEESNVLPAGKVHDHVAPSSVLTVIVLFLDAIPEGGNPERDNEGAVLSIVIFAVLMIAKLGFPALSVLIMEMSPIAYSLAPNVNDVPVPIV